jgi:hypothetical protein
VVFTLSRLPPAFHVRTATADRTAECCLPVLTQDWRIIMKALLRSRLTWLSVLAACGFFAAVVLATLLDGDSAVEETFNHDLYASIMAEEVAGIADIVADFEYRQLAYLPIVVPNPEYIHVQRGGILPFDPARSRFPKEFIEGLVAIEEGAVMKYPITVYEDPRTRERIVLNARNERIGGQYAPWDYDPQWYVKQQYPGLSEMDPDEARQLIAIYDGSRIVCTYDLMLKEDVVRHVVKQSIDAAVRAGKSGAGGGGMRAGWEGGPVSNLQFTVIDWETNGTMTVTLAYPEAYQTNSGSAFDIFTCDSPRGLVGRWWDPGTTTNADSSTNWVSWNDTGVNREYGDVRYYVAAVSNDVDGDGATDGFERYVSHTGVTNSNSYPVCVSGTISYSGILTGPVRMVAVTASNDWTGPMASIPFPGPYANDRVAVGTSYWFKAYRDSDEDRLCDYWEAQGAYAANPVDVTDDVSGVDISLSNPGDDNDADNLPDWWEMHYFGDLDEGPGDDEPDGDGLVNSNEYTEGTDPTDGDTDDDGMGDGAETSHGNSPTSSNTYATLPFYDDFELFEKLRGTASSTNFGCSVSLDADTLLVGAFDPGSVTNCFAFVYAWNGATWQQQTVLSAPTGATCFGISVDIHGDRAVVGAYREDNTGGAHVYERTGTNWSHMAKLTASDTADNDYFGCAVAVHDETVLVGAYGNNSEKGSAYVFTGSGSSWQQCTNMYGTYPCRMGRAVDISDTRLVVGADGWNGGWSWQGFVNVYAWDGTNATFQQRVRAEVLEKTAAYGCSVDIDGDTLAIGSKGYDSFSHAYGAAYVYTWDGVSWTNEELLVASGHQDQDYFGVSIALEGSNLLVGAYKDDDSGTDSGSAHIYTHDGTNWNPALKLSKDIATSAGDLFGGSVALSGDRAIVGSVGDIAADSSRFGSTYSLSLSNYFARLHQNQAFLLGHRDWAETPQRRSRFSSKVAHDGSLSVFLGCTAPKIEHLIAASGTTNVWIDCRALLDTPLPLSSSSAYPDIATFPECCSAAFAVGPDGLLVAYDGSDGGAWETATNAVVSTGAFHRYTVRQDYITKKWDLYLDGTNVFLDLGFRSSDVAEFSAFSWCGPWARNAYLDHVVISDQQPSF